MSDKRMWEGWAILEMLGHRKLAGLITEEVIAGKGMLRIDVPEKKKTTFVTQYINPDAIYALTPCDEKIARAFALTCDPVEPHRWSLNIPALKHAAYSEED